MTLCERVQTHLNDFLDGTLGAALAQELNAHLQECAACREEFHALRTTQELLRAIPTPDGEASRRRVLARFRQAVQEQTAAQEPVPAYAQRRVTYLGMALASSLALLLVLCVCYPRSGPDSAPPTTAMHILETASCDQALPSAQDLEEMTSLHAIQSIAVANGNEELQQEALADANAHLQGHRKPAR